MRPEHATTVSRMTYEFFHNKKCLTMKYIVILNAYFKYSLRSLSEDGTESIDHEVLIAWGLRYHGCATDDDVNTATILSIDDPRMEKLYLESNKEENGVTTLFDRRKLTLVWLKLYGDDISFAVSVKKDINAFNKVIYCT